MLGTHTQAPILRGKVHHLRVSHELPTRRPALDTRALGARRGILPSIWPPDPAMTAATKSHASGLNFHFSQLYQQTHSKGSTAAPGTHAAVGVRRSSLMVLLICTLKKTKTKVLVEFSLSIIRGQYTEEWILSFTVQKGFLLRSRQLATADQFKIKGATPQRNWYCSLTDR